MFGASGQLGRTLRAAIALVAGLAVLSGATYALGSAALGTVNQVQSAKKKKKRKGRESFQVYAYLDGKLSPGRTLPIKLTVSNDRPRSIWVTQMRLKMSIDAAHKAAGCSTTRDFRLRQIPEKFTPFKLKANTVKHSGGSAKGKKGKKGKKQRKGRKGWKPFTPKGANGPPTITMLNLPHVNQDACKGAKLTIQATAKSVPRKPRKRKSRKKAVR